MTDMRAAYVSLALGALVIVGISNMLADRVSPSLAASVHETTAPLFLDQADLEATSALLYDPEDGRILFSKYGELQLPLASLTKVATVALTLDTLPAGSHITIEPSDLLPEGDSGLLAGQAWDATELSRFTLRFSSNDGAQALARTAFPEGTARMNVLARALGLSQTYFLNPTGLDVSSTTAGAYGSALDTAKLFAYLLKAHPEALDLTVNDSIPVVDLSGSVQPSVSTAATLLDIPGLLGAKTGFTDLAGGNLVVAFDAGPGRPLIAVVLGSSREGRFEDVRTLIRAVRQPLSL